MTPEQERDEKLALVRRHIAQLAEHFDTVQIFCTKSEGKNTVQWKDGVGNWYARYGQVSAWLAEEKRIIESEAVPQDGGEFA